MKKHWLLVLLSSIMLFGCYDPNEWWTEEETANMVQYAKNVFDEVKDIVNDYNGTIVEEYYDNNFKGDLTCHYFHYNLFAFNINSVYYQLSFELTPENNVKIHELKLLIDGPMYSNPNECVFKKEQYLAINDLFECLDKLVNVKSFVSLDKIEECMHIAKASNIERKGGGSYRVRINNQYHMVDYDGLFLYVKDNDSDLYNNFFSLEFSKCSDRFY